MVGLIVVVLGYKFYWWIDPVGAVALAFYNISNWGKTVLENAVSQVGQSGPPEVLQKLTYLVKEIRTMLPFRETVVLKISDLDEDRQQMGTVV
ncbi:hypothetical protein AgCh_027539 [Apium graveolens]